MSFNGNHGDVPRHRPTAVEQETLDWIARHDRGLTPEQEAEFDSWLAADEQHAVLFAEFSDTWALLDRVPEISGSAAPAGLAAVSDGPKSRPQIRTSPPGGSRSWMRPRWITVGSLAAAAVFAVAYFPSPSVEAVHGVNSPYNVNVATEVGELRKMTLRDGSILQLNTDSAVEVRFSTAERRLRLIRGEAHFIVAKNRARPFIVHAGGVDVRAVGTVFNVRLRSKALEVLVTEGKVTVRDEPDERPDATGSTAGSEGAPDESAQTKSFSLTSATIRPLVAGEKITIPLSGSGAVSTATATVSVPLAEIEHTLAWKDRRLEFASAPLADMVEEFNRYNRRKLVIADPDLGAQHFGGTFRADDPAGFVRALEVNFGVVAEQGAEATILRLAAR